jgi:PAS domain S-box-containing protein
VTASAPDPVVSRWLRTAGCLLAALGLVVLAGRFTGIRGLVTLFPGGGPMAFPTAAGFVLAGAVLFALGRGRMAAGRAGARGLAALGAGTIALYLLAEPLGIRRFALDGAQPGTAPGTGFDGWMTPNTAVAFALLGVLLLRLAAGRGWRRVTGAGIAVLLAIAAVALVSQLIGLRLSTRWWRFAAMAVPTAVALLGAATVLLVWLTRQTAGPVARTVPFFTVAGTVVLVLAGTVMVSNAEREGAAQLETRTLEVDAGLDRFIASVARLESATRAYALTGEERYLERIQIHRASVAAATEALVQLTADEAEQHARALRLRPLVERKFAVNEAQVRARRDEGVAAAARVLQAEPPELMAGLREATDGMQAQEHLQLMRRRADTATNEARLRWVLLAGGVATVALVAMAFSLVWRAQEQLRGLNEQLEARVRGRTAELEASAARLRFLADTMPQLVWTARPDGTLETLNRGFLDFLGTADEAAAREEAAAAAHPDDAAATQAEWGAMRGEGRPGGGETRLRRADGAWRWHLWRAHPERDAAGAIVRWVGTSTDIHAHKESEEALERRVAERAAELTASEERFRQAFDHAGIGMTITALDGRFLRVNRSLCEITGYTEAELLRRRFQDITHPDDLAEDLAHVRELLASPRRFFQMEKRYVHQAGHAVWIRLTASLLRDAAGRPENFIGQIEDITEHKALQASLAGARDQALEASRLKSEFLATMSHEIRTPMNGVIGMTALLRDTPLTPAQADYVRTIEQSGESLLTIINDILDYSKIEAGRIELEVAPFDLRQCLEDALDLFAGKAREKGLELAYTMAADVPATVAGDATRLRQVLVNLLGNAVKFTDAGEVDVSVETEPAAGGGPRRLRFAVRDTGIGIPEAGMERLFKSFSQVDASTTRRFGGTGLGLAISKRLAELMGGTMRAESRPGEGSTFRFTVALEARPGPAGARNLQAPQPELQGRRLLVVDDSATQRRVVGTLARTWGMTVREAASGREALAALAADAGCDVAVVDLQMPEMDGAALAAAIRARPATAGVPLVLLTVPGRTERPGEFAQATAKPVHAEALCAALLGCVRPAAEPAARSSGGGTFDGRLAERHPLRILIAEDNPVNQRVASLMLQRLGYRAATAGNGLEALAAFELTDYDVVLMDVDMPELDGCEATRRLRATRGSATRPWVIALTAGAMPGDRERALGAGMNDFLTKPVRSESLAAALVQAHGALAKGPA